MALVKPKKAVQQSAPVVPFNQFATGGSLIDDIDVTIIDAGFAEWDYNGNLDHKILACAIQYEDADGKTYDQYYSAGELKFFVPSEDTGTVVPVGDRQLLNDNTNFAQFLMSLTEAGMPEEIMGAGDVRAFIGTKCHVAQHSQPKRTGLIRGGNAEREPTVLLVTEILEFPGEAAAAPKKAVGRPVPKAAPARPTPGAPARPTAGTPVKSASSTAPARATTARSTKTSPSKANGSAETAEDMERGLASEILQQVLVEADGSVEKKNLHTLVFRAATAKVQAGELDAKAKVKVVQLIFTDAFLKTMVEEGIIEYDGGVLAIAA